MTTPLIDHEAATREIAKGLELTTRLRSLLRDSAGGATTAKSDGQLESLSQEIMQALVAALSILMPVKSPAKPSAPGADTAVESATTSRPMALDITLGRPGRCKEAKARTAEEISGSEENTLKQGTKRSHLHSGTMISYELSSDDNHWKSNGEKKIKTKLSRNHQHSWTTTTSLPFSDGHQWRKYGEKKISNCKMPRCYYRCTFKDDQGCPATKQVQQKDSEDPPMFVVTYKQQHSCRNRGLPLSSQPVAVVANHPPPADLCHLRL